jgi:hypothetical protein
LSVFADVDGSVDTDYDYILIQAKEVADEQAQGRITFKQIAVA